MDQTTVEESTSPDETGSDTFSRYVYQAHVAFSYCLDCAELGDVEAVVLEHFEDLAVYRGGDRWDFNQIKTRDADQGAWTLTDLLGKSGPLRSLHRTYRALSKVQGDFQFFALLEGSIKSGDDGKELTGPSQSTDGNALARVAKALKITEAEARLFLDRLSVVDNLPTRPMIAAANVRQLSLSAPDTSGRTVEQVYDAVLSQIQTAMDIPRLDSRWPKAAITPRNFAREIRTRFERKCLRKEDLAPLFSDLQIGSSILLSQLADPAIRTTALEDKLRAAGHSEQTVENAKQLRARAAIRESELHAAHSDPAPNLEDVRIRLRMLADAVLEEVLSEEMPPAHVWSRLQNRIEAQRSSLDQGSLFNQDAFVLLGELCQISDLCEFSWGARNA